MKIYKLTCPNCNGTLNIDIDKDSKSIFCPYCGEKLYLDNENVINKTININKDININKNINKSYTNVAQVIKAKTQANEERKAFRQIIILLIIMLMIPICIFLGININKNVAQREGKINAGNYTDLVGKHYKTVEAHFKAAGFNNIELIDLKDSGAAFWKNGKVEIISVGGKTDFESIDWFFPDTKVVISYH